MCLIIEKVKYQNLDIGQQKKWLTWKILGSNWLSENIREVNMLILQHFIKIYSKTTSSILFLRKS